MHPRISELLQFIDGERAKLRAAVDSVPADQRERAPGEAQWSVAGVLEHLGTVEKRITNLFRTRIAEARAAGIQSETDTSPILPQLGMEMVEDRTQRLRAPTPIQPSAKLDSETAWNALEASRRDFRDAVLEADGLALNEISHPHLYFGPLTMYQWIAFTASHEARHAAQIREIGTTLSQRPA